MAAGHGVGALHAHRAGQKARRLSDPRRSDWSAVDTYSGPVAPTHLGTAELHAALPDLREAPTDVGRVDLMERHKDEKPVSISGKEIRATLQKCEMVDTRVMRPSTSEVLAAAMAGK